MHLLTTNSSYRVRFDLVSFNGRWAYAEYSNFRIGPESDNYRLYISKYSGNASDYNCYFLCTQPIFCWCNANFDSH